MTQEGQGTRVSAVVPCHSNALGVTGRHKRGAQALHSGCAPNVAMHYDDVPEYFQEFGTSYTLFQCLYLPGVFLLSRHPPSIHYSHMLVFAISLPARLRVHYQVR